MNIEFDSEEDKELFKVLLDNFMGYAVPEPDEEEFINKLYECVRSKT